MINAVHQTSIRRFKRQARDADKNSYYIYSSPRVDVEKAKNDLFARGGVVRVTNYSEGDISPKVKNFISNVINIGIISKVNDFYVNDNIMISSVLIGRRHNVDIMVDLDAADDGIIASIYDPALGREHGRVGRIAALGVVLQNAGFSISDYQRAGGLQAR